MASQNWRTQFDQLAQLEPSLLRQIRDEADRLLNLHERKAHSESNYAVADGSFFDFDRLTTCSSASTLYQSGRSTPQASSISSDNTSAFDASSVYASGIHNTESLSFPLEDSNDRRIWPTLPATDRRNLLQTSLRQETLRRAHTSSPILGLSVLPQNGSTKRQFFCTFCLEDEKPKVIKTKQDWKRHEEDYHFGTGNEWHCQVKGCSGVFQRGVDFKQHLKKDHHGQVYPRDSKEVVQQRRIYACGYDNCRELNYKWKDHCDHVGNHMLKGHTQWNYDRTIRNLLKHPALSKHWKDVYTTLGPQYNLLQTQLKWDPKTTRSMRHQLEYHNFGNDLLGFLQKLFLAGVPTSSATFYTGAPLLPPTFLPLLPPTTSSCDLPVSLQGSNIPFGDLSEQTKIDTSFPHHHQLTIDNTNVADIATTTYTYGNRNSVVMLDAPNMTFPEAQVPYDGDHVETIPPPDQELLSFEDVISHSPPYYNIRTPPVPLPSTSEDNISTPDAPRSSSRRGLMRKSREWLTAKRSQHSQNCIIIEHPDVPQNTRMPASPRKTAFATEPTPTTNRLYSNQS